MIEDPALTTLHRYFDNLDRYDVDGLLGCFSKDAVYVHPPYAEVYGGFDDEAAAFQVARGHDGLREIFAKRGQQTATHHVTAFARNGSICFNEGYMLDGAGEVACTWVTCFHVDDDDLITIYIPHATAPPIPVVVGAGAPTSIQVENA